jgi:hypothetical protein
MPARVASFIGRGTLTNHLSLITIFHRWLDAKLNRPVGGKQRRLVAALGQLFTDTPVPDPQVYPRKRLRDDLMKRDPFLKSLDHKTLQTAIETHNRGIGNSRNTNVYD